jgi:hypothetical protein
MGFPPVFFRASSTAGRNLRAFLLSKGYTDGFEWNYSDVEDSDVVDRDKALRLAALVIIVGILLSSSYCVLRQFLLSRDSKKSRLLLSEDVSYASVSLIDEDK